MAAGLTSLACTTTIHPALAPESEDLENDAFSHASLDAVLQRFVDAQGRVDYRALASDRDAFDRYYSLLSEISPDDHPAYFASESDRLAYWINAYNAAVLTTVLAHYPIRSVGDVRPPAALFFLPRLSGFFFFQRVRLGDETMSLYALENEIVRKRFGEPRIHFALNCASASCPRLPRRAFEGRDLERRLDEEARRFVAEERNVKIDPEQRRIRLSAIFGMYEDDFLDPLRAEGSAEDPTLLDYILPLLSEEKARRLRACAECEVEILDFDWALNDQSPVEQAHSR